MNLVTGQSYFSIITISNVRILVHHFRFIIDLTLGNVLTFCGIVHKIHRQTFLNSCSDQLEIFKYQTFHRYTEVFNSSVCHPAMAIGTAFLLKVFCWFLLCDIFVDTASGVEIKTARTFLISSILDVL
jgi:hypothetical protein